MCMNNGVSQQDDYMTCRMNSEGERIDFAQLSSEDKYKVLFTETKTLMDHATCKECNEQDLNIKNIMRLYLVIFGNLLISKWIPGLIQL